MSQHEMVLTIEMIKKIFDENGFYSHGVNLKEQRYWKSAFEGLGY